MDAKTLSDPRLLDSVCYDLVLADWPRGKNRALIDSINNGEPPYTPEEAESNNVVVNINDLTHTRLVHDARAQMTNSLLKTGNHFRASTDWPKLHVREKYGSTVTSIINKAMRRSPDYIQYYERQRAKSGMLMLHGISPGVWENEDDWCTQPLGVADVLVPGNTKLGFKNMPLYVLRRSFTGIELQHLTNTATRDPGWNMDMVKACLEWMDSQMTQLRSTNWPDVWSPEKVQERVKSDGGQYMGDAVPTIDCFDIFAWCGNGKEEGWVRRIILDSWGEPSQAGVNSFRPQRLNRKSSANSKSIDEGTNFLFTSEERMVSPSWQQNICFQFADLSGVFPARYHSIRSLGWMIYASAHVGMRMRCKFWESVFESLNMMFEVNSLDDAQNALKLDLVNRGFIDSTIRPVKAQDRWQVNAALVEMGMQDVASVISENASSWTQNQNKSQDRTEKTKFQVMAELQAVIQLVSAAMNQAFQYEVFEAREIFRRFIKKGTKNPDCRMAQAAILKKVPEKYLVPEAWDIEVERPMGGGNRTMEMTIAQWLMENREKYDPDSQRIILRDATLAISDNPDKAEQLVPEQPVISNSVHDAQLAAATLLLRLPMAFKDGVNHQEYAGALIGAMASQIQKIDQQKQGTPTPDELEGLQNLAGQTVQGQPIQGNGAATHIKALAGDPTAQQVVKQLNDALSKQMDMLKKFAQHLQAAMQKAAQQNGNGADPKDIAKLQITQAQGQQKIDQMKRSGAQRTVQKQISWEQQMLQRKQEHQFEMEKMQREHALDLQTSAREHAANLAKVDLEAASNIHRNKLSSTEEE